jgi:hypothetical protein
MAQKMGIGKLGDRNLVIKRKFRWTFQISKICGGRFADIPEHFVATASRPSLTIEEKEIDFLNAKTWIPGKGAWETITVTYRDVASRDNTPLWNWLASVYDYSEPGQLNQGSSRNDYAATGFLILYDGCGLTLETWTLNDMWPTSVNFGDLDYTSQDEATIELTLRYSSVEYKSHCPDFDPKGCCTGCEE